MTLFASVHPDSFSDDPAPYVHVDYDYTEVRLPYPASGFEFAPRPEYARPTTHDVNPLLVAFRRPTTRNADVSWSTTDVWLAALERTRGYLDTGKHVALASPATDRVDAILNSIAPGAADGRDARARIQAVVDHAYEVLVRVHALRAIGRVNHPARRVYGYFTANNRDDLVAKVTELGVVIRGFGDPTKYTLGSLLLRRRPEAPGMLLITRTYAAGVYGIELLWRDPAPQLPDALTAAINRLLPSPPRRQRGHVE
ncbi:hypothetical protein [Curtobacterium sp. MCBD17_040]|uniref:hypothetical protein n=1 Tax=Curtobacterium sp. MCBD17_040 TaxID=2175674 RepID=UPI000DA6F577|nr:hypothetical protein [Curtobacterium sp. MCBD17_040]WIB65286.1 hypothetical protein DEI94_17935 [Curtobacterium sp. MCBD17_040]